jgi:NitT/TauT family transport system permease protein
LEDLPFWTLPVLALAVLLICWELIIDVLNVPRFVLPAPSAIFSATLAGRDQIPYHALSTTAVTLAGFGVSIVIGVGLGVLIVSSRLIRGMFYPLLIVAQSVPKVAIAPVLLIALGYGEVPKTIIVFLVCFFPIVVSTVSGLEMSPPEMLELARSMSATPVDTFRKIRFPAAMPHIFSGLKVAITLAVIGTVIAEFIGSDHGLGYLILVSTSQANTGLAFGAIIILAAVSILLFYSVELVERLLLPWRYG